jgi:hypothetical protein
MLFRAANKRIRGVDCYDDGAYAEMVWVLIMPRSATTQMRPTPNRARNRSTTGRRVVTSAVLLIHDQPDDQKEAIKRRDQGEESLTEIGRSYNVSAATISRLAT